MLSLKVITPEQVLSNKIVDSVTVSTLLGVITVRTKHSPLISAINEGELIINSDNTKDIFAIHRGVLCVRPHKLGVSEVTILIESGEHLDDIVHDRAREAIERANKLKEELHEDDVAFAFFESEVERELNKLKTFIKYRK